VAGQALLRGRHRRGKGPLAEHHRPGGHGPRRNGVAAPAPRVAHLDGPPGPPQQFVAGRRRCRLALFFLVSFFVIHYSMALGLASLAAPRLLLAAALHRGGGVCSSTSAALRKY
jgi:hypothetical protein